MLAMLCKLMKLCEILGSQEPSFKSNMWGLVRHLIVLLVVVSAVSQFANGMGGGGGIPNYEVEPDATGDKTYTFDDVQGSDEAKEELQNVVAFLRDPESFTRLGGRQTKGTSPLFGPTVSQPPSHTFFVWGSFSSQASPPRNCRNFWRMLPTLMMLCKITWSRCPSHGATRYWQNLASTCCCWGSGGAVLLLLRVRV